MVHRLGNVVKKGEGMGYTAYKCQRKRNWVTNIEEFVWLGQRSARLSGLNYFCYLKHFF